MRHMHVNGSSQGKSNVASAHPTAAADVYNN